MRKKTSRIDNKIDILLVGQPNVGKSVLFSRLTGIKTVVSNYSGTTVAFARGKMRWNGTDFTVVDAPGTYSLEPLDDASWVTVDLIDDARRIINVVDASHLERHLPLTMEVLAQNKPTILVLNMSDEARYRGITIDAEKLSHKLGVPVIPIVARSGEGVKKMISTLFTLQIQKGEEEKDERGHPGHHPHLFRKTKRKHIDDHSHLDRRKIWEEIGNIVSDVQTLKHHHKSFAERMEELTVHPLWGSLFALIVLFLSFSLIRLIGEFLISGGVGIIGEPWMELPFGTELLFENLLKPLLKELSLVLGEKGFLHRLLIGTLIEGEIDFSQSFGILTSGLFIPLAAVLPYLVSFYLVLSLLEDVGYLPRLAVFMDSLMHRIGLHGYAIIPTLLSLGCNVPGIMATRILETKRQRFITATLISIAVPCAALQAMIVALVGDRGALPLAIVYGTLLLVWIVLGIILRFVAKGFKPELLIEIPPYRLPDLNTLLSKLWMRLLSFFKEALPIIIGTVLVVNILYQFQLFDLLARLTEPLVTRMWGMPKEAIVPLFVGILRKDVAMGMFIPLQLTTKQLVVASVVLAMFFPCLATFVILFRELGIKEGLKSTGIMFLTVFIAGSALNLTL
ncbi:MAG: ferrous iron transport protein B [Spirochaetes bacterium]|nr:MAG: ferrous iron transport protein B [Spirochaetota bacterium]